MAYKASKGKRPMKSGGSKPKKKKMKGKKY